MLLVLGVACSARNPVPIGGAADRDAYVVLLSFDGFRHDYLDRGITPSFDRLAAAGVRADALVPVFPTKTFPNHYSIVTGMYVASHGIVSNGFYEPERDEEYRLGDRASVEDGTWYGGEPLWVTAEKQGMVSASMFWVGSEAAIQGIRPTYWNLYDGGYQNADRVRQILEWLALPPGERPHMITGYFSLLDDVGHRYGPESAEVHAGIVEADSLLELLMRGIEALPHGDAVSIIVTSDHGMAEVGRGFIDLDAEISLEGVRVLVGNPVANLYFAGDSARADGVRETLSRLANIRVFRRSELPERWHADHPRSGDLIVIAEEGWSLGLDPERAQWSGGTHGYPPLPSMHGIFVAAGPRIRAGLRIPPFENIHVYPLVTEILGLVPNRDIDGRLEVLAPVLMGVGAAR